MKKLLLIAAIAATSISANAQQKVDFKNVQTITDNVKFVDESTVTRGQTMEVPNMYYYRPYGLFYAGWNVGSIAPAVAFAPANTTLKFNAVYTEGTPVWTYPNGQFDGEGQPLAATFKGDNIELNLAAGTYFVPYIQNEADPQGDFFAPSSELQVGGTTGKGVIEMDGQEYCGDAYAVNYVPTANLANLASYFCTANADADAKAGADLFGDDSYKTLGFGEQFVSPAKFQVKGFNALVIGSKEIATKAMEPKYVKPQIIVYEADGSFSILKDEKSFTAQVTEIDVNEKEQLGVYFLEFTINGDPITVEPNQMIAVAYSSKKVQMSPFIDLQPRWDEQTFKDNQNITTMILNQQSEFGNGFLPIPGLEVPTANGTKYVNSWCIGLDMSYAENGFAGIDNVVAEEVAGNGAVYSLEGVKVSNGDVENLPAGVYVKDGKKFVVR